MNETSTENAADKEASTSSDQTHLNPDLSESNPTSPAPNVDATEQEAECAPANDTSQDEALARALQEEFSLADADREPMGPIRSRDLDEDNLVSRRRNSAGAVGISPSPSLSKLNSLKVKIGLGSKDELAQTSPMSALVAPSTKMPSPLKKDFSESTAPNEKTDQTTHENSGEQSSRPPPTPPRKLDTADYRPTEVPFDFNRFLEQMRHRSALPITKYFKSFLREFDRRPWNVNEQIKIVQDFLEFIFEKMRQCELWATASDEEFENAKEGMEKLVMNRLHQHLHLADIVHRSAFSPSTADDAERDDVLFHKVEIFRWVKEEHLDITASPHNESFLQFAQSELLKINNYKAPRDKLICILNCCKVIFGLIKHVEGDAGADKFFPVLVFVVLKSNPAKLVSNVQYISRFRQPSKLQSEAGYYLTNLMGAISFVETMDVSSLSITQEEFESNIERTMKDIGNERPAPEEFSGPVTYTNAINPSSQRTDASRQRNSNSLPPQNSGSAPATNTPSNETPPTSTNSLPRSSSQNNLLSINLDKQLDKAQALFEKGEQFLEKTMQKAGKFFDDNLSSPPSSPDQTTTARYRPRDYQQRHDAYPDGASQSGPNSRTGSPFNVADERSHAGLYPGNVANNGTAAAAADPSFTGRATRPSPLAINTNTPEYKEASKMLKSMFSTVEPQVVDIIFQDNHGQLSPSIDFLLEIASTTNANAGAELTTVGADVATNVESSDAVTENAPLVDLSDGAEGGEGHLGEGAEASGADPATSTASVTAESTTSPTSETNSIAPTTASTQPPEEATPSPKKAKKRVTLQEPPDDSLI